MAEDPVQSVAAAAEDPVITTEDPDDQSYSGLDFGFEIQQMTDDADAILESIRNEATTPAPRKGGKKKKSSSSSKSPGTPSSLGDHFARQERNSSSKKKTASPLKKSAALSDDTDSLVMADTDSLVMAGNDEDNQSLTDNNSVTTDSLVTDLDDDDLTLNTQDNSLMTDEHNHRMSAELMAAALNAAEDEFNQAQHEEKMDIPTEISFTTADQGITVSAILVWGLVIFLLSQFLGGGRILDENGVMSFPSLLGETSSSL
eukprot:CAMPEP_0172446868 /NCGR_PEP_ID=MMETSP1065-20121228/6335_1 /TAXON_ID=265537 /ORGANISM="Amphiprora paludosa, Strain CCMP125" /LENGTH=258 /DNA_ID=CAMNT_0013198057 /DNA_START=17 /DNA_END=793 /DNA_ORIENTATION=+